MAGGQVVWAGWMGVLLCVECVWLRVCFVWRCLWALKCRVLLFDNMVDCYAVSASSAWEWEETAFLCRLHA